MFLCYLPVLLSANHPADSAGDAAEGGFCSHTVQGGCRLPGGPTLSLPAACHLLCAANGVLCLLAPGRGLSCNCQ